jgi:hypothetical protein
MRDDTIQKMTYGTYPDGSLRVIAHEGATTRDITTNPGSFADLVDAQTAFVATNADTTRLVRANMARPRGVELPSDGDVLTLCRFTSLFFEHATSSDT